MISCRLCGGLGNQLFQIYTTIAYAETHGKSFFFLNNKQLGSSSNPNVTLRYTYWDTFLSNMKPYLKNMHQIPEMKLLKEQSFDYNALPSINTNNNNNILLVGYFQSPKYFDSFKDNIRKLLDIRNQSFKIMKKNERLLLTLNYTISMHFRFGDYKKYPHVYPLLQLDYYEKALEYILEKVEDGYNACKVIYFCEEESMSDSEVIINALTEKYQNTVHFVRAPSDLADWEQMLLMSVCNHNIIANSTFSWWGAYLNEGLYLNDKEKPIVCYPSKWFVNKDTPDLFPEEWVKIDVP